MLSFRAAAVFGRALLQCLHDAVLQISDDQGCHDLPPKHSK